MFIFRHSLADFLWVKLAIVVNNLVFQPRLRPGFFITMLTTKDVEEYQKIHTKVYGKNISYADALEQGTRLLNFFKIITKPVPNNKFGVNKK